MATRSFCRCRSRIGLCLSRACISATRPILSSGLSSVACPVPGPTRRPKTLRSRHPIVMPLANSQVLNFRWVALTAMHVYERLVRSNVNLPLGCDYWQDHFYQVLTGSRRGSHFVVYRHYPSLMSAVTFPDFSCEGRMEV